MLLKVNNEYLDFDGDIEIERQAKLLEDISGIAGDFSYSFQIPDTSYNRDKLSLTTIDTTFPYKVNNCEVQSNEGVTLYAGYLRVESVTDFINASVYSNNSDWINIMDVNMRDFDFSSLNVSNASDGTKEASWTKSSGVVFPLINSGVMHDRADPSISTAELKPWVYVRDVIKSALTQRGIKLKGDILKEPRFNKLITSNNSRAGFNNEVEARTVLAGKSATQAITSFSYQKVTFPTVDGLYYNSPNENWDTVQSTYVSDKICTINITINIKVTSAIVSTHTFSILSNGVNIKEFMGGLVSGGTRSFTYSYQYTIGAGSFIEIQAKKGPLGSDYTILADSSISVIPIRFSDVFVRQLVPNMKAHEFIAQIFRLSNVITFYNPMTKELGTTLFKNLKNNPEIDLSPYLTKIIDENFSEFINGYFKQTNLLYAESDDDDIKSYDTGASINYGGGSLTIDNDFLDESGDLFKLDFLLPFQKDVPWLGNSLPIVNMVQYVEVEDTKKDVTSITDNGSGYAKLNWASGNPYVGEKFVKLYDSTVTDYEGIYDIISVGVTSIVISAPFTGTATATLVALDFEDIDNDNQYLLLNAPSVAISDFSAMDDLTVIEIIDTSTIALGFAYLPDKNFPINNSQKEALYFEKVIGTSINQVSLIESYYSDAEKMLNKPLTILATFYLPESVFNSIDFTRPIRLRTDKFNSLFYCNRISGYSGSHLPCEVELIKLS